ncbi:LysM peptidoglycan-binding domain-containing protein [bacterium]|nr:LysM peptidoglycan-binding domain-containing protein [bacterium]
MSKSTLKRFYTFSTLLVVLLLSSCAHRNGAGESVAWEDDSEAVETLPDLGSDFRSGSRNKSEVEADRLARITFPLVRNELVDMWINYFTVRPKGRQTFAKWLSRSTRYIPLIKKVLKEEGLPEDLIYLSMIESGFNPRAYSHASAVGPWQFISGTGKRYGLQINYFIDERRDIAKSTKAAAQYLKELYQIFGSWYLAAASYNAGEGRTLNAIRRNRTRNFWELARGKENFRRETRNYVPKIIAAALIAKDPEKYGFTNIKYEEPLTWVSVEIPQGIDLRSVAEVSNASFESLRLLNAELVIGITPPDSKEKFLVRVPPESEASLVANLNKLKAKKVSHFIVHRVRSGENLGSIARKYRTKVRTIMELNRVKNARRIQIGQRLRVPVPLRGSSRSTSQRSIASVSRSRTSKGWEVHKVRRGETLSGIADQYKTSARSLMRLNGIRSARSLRAGQVLKIKKSLEGSRTTSRSGNYVIHKVRRGETLSEIAQKYKTRTRTLLRLNDLKSARNLQAGQNIRVKKDNDS